MNHELIDPDLLRTKIAQEATYLINTGMLTPIPHPFVVVEPRSNKAKAGGLHVLYVAVSSLLSGSGKLSMDYIDTPEFRKRLGGQDRAAPWLRLSNAMGMTVLDLMTLDSICLGSPSNFGMKGMQQAAWAQACGMNVMGLGYLDRHLQALQALKDFRDLPKRSNGTVDWNAALPEGDEGGGEGSLR